LILTSLMVDDVYEPKTMTSMTSSRLPRCWNQLLTVAHYTHTLHSV